ncbi:MAG: MFS transporter [Pseudomonadota bacterium]
MNATRLSLATKLHYSVGQVGFQMLGSAISFFLMIFYTDVALVAPAVASSALLIDKVWDAFNDPLFGYMVDHTRSRHGRRRVYLIYGALPLAGLAAAVWMVPSGLSPLMAFIWIAVTYTLFDTALTLVQLSYSAMSAEMTTDYDERTSLTAFSSIGALMGFVLGSVAMPMIVKSASNTQMGYAMAGAILGLTAGACAGWVAWRVREPHASDTGAHDDATPWSGMRAALRSRPFALLALGCGLARLGLTLATGAMAYFVVYQLQGSKDDVPRYLGGMLGVVALSIPMWRQFASRWEKNTVYMAALTLAACGFAWMFWIPADKPSAMWGAIVLIGLGMGGHWVVPYSMLPDAVDFAHASGQDRQTGMFYGLFGLVDKIARTVAIAAIGWILQVSHYVPNVTQSQESLLGIRLVAGLLPAVFLLLALPFLWAYPITRARHARAYVQ